MQNLFLVIALTSSLLSCTCETQTNDQYNRQIAKATGVLSVDFEYPLDPADFQLKEIDSFLLVRVDTFAQFYPYPNSYWHGLFDLTNDGFNYTRPLSITESDIPIISPVIRNLRANELHLIMAKKLEENYYSFEFRKVSDHSRGIQQRYELQGKHWIWIKNNVVYDKELESIRLSNIMK